MPKPSDGAAASPRRGRDGALTRARIETAALELFARRGVEGATIRDIAGAVGVAEAALYRHFPSKDAIAAHLFTTHYGAIARDIRAVDARDAPFSERVGALVGLFCAFFDDAPDAFAFILLNQHAHLRFVAREDNVAQAIADMVARASAAGEIAVADVDLAAAAALGAVLQPAVFKLYGRLPGPLRAHAAELTRLALGALGAR